MPGPEPWQSCRGSVDQPSNTSEDGTHRSLTRVHRPAAPRSTSPASYPSFASPFHLSSFCLAVSVIVTPIFPFLHLSTQECDTFFDNHLLHYLPQRQLDSLTINRYICIGTCFGERQNSATNPRLGQPPVCVVLTRDVSTRPVA